ncbi:MAG: hypothetical protein OEX22_09820 [Cyclobacteriaceae bacterium]|nr:hypothetical protein [Cyclobacteriaceae bacterium]
MGLIGTNMSLRTQANQANQQLIQCGQLDQFKVDDLKIKVVTRDSIISNLMILIDKLGAEKAL